MLILFWASVTDNGPTLHQYWKSVHRVDNNIIIIVINIENSRHISILTLPSGRHYCVV